MDTPGSLRREPETGAGSGADIEADIRERTGMEREPNRTAGVQAIRRSRDGWAGAIRQLANNNFDRHKRRATGGLDEIARAIRQSAEPFAEHGRSRVADCARRAADHIERLAHRIDERRLDDVLQDVERFARRQPALFIGAAFGLGLLGARFLKSSGDQSMAGMYGAPAYQRGELWTRSSYTNEITGGPVL